MEGIFLGGGAGHRGFVEKDQKTSLKNKILQLKVRRNIKT